MKAAEAAALLTIAAAYDNRKPDADAAKAWSLVLDGLRFEDCRDSIVSYYRNNRAWIMPSDVIAGVKALRRERLSKFDNLVRLEPPAHLADDPAAEIAWFNTTRLRVANGEITHPDQVDERGELKPRDVASLGLVGRTVPRG